MIMQRDQVDEVVQSNELECSIRRLVKLGY